jgi:hypothetical protein
MRKLFITGVLLCSAIILIGAQTGFAWPLYDGGCMSCHGTGFAALNTHGVPAHSASACTICHVTSGDVPATSKCIVCHPASGPGKCNLVNAAVHAAASCTTCHAAECAVTTTTTTVPAEDCITIEPTSVTVDGVNDETLDVVVTFTRLDVINIPPDDLGKLVIEVDTTCAQYITLNGSPVINVNTTNVTATQNVTVAGDALASECSIKVSDPEGIADPPLNCVASFTIFSSPTTTTTVPTTTTTVPQTECTVTVAPSPAFLKLKSALLRPVIRRIAITGDGSNFNRSTAVSIEDIPIVIPLRVQNPEGMFALIVIPPRIFGRFEPGEKEVGVVTGSEFCTGTVEIE